MIHNASFRRKVIYLGLIALLLIPLYVVGHPAVGDPSDSTDSQSSPGGRLAVLRTEYDLSPAELGEIDPTSESMKLATLGMRGVAANILWTKANDYKKKENWEGLVAVVNQMARLQPNFISIWEFQSHNLSYNISVEQDDYRFRYLWVKRGIEFLIQGTKYNRREPKLFWTLGWYNGQKFGRADEHKQFRRLFRVDRDFHDLQSPYVDIYGEGIGIDGNPDTWLTSRLWFNEAYRIVDHYGRPVRGKSEHIFYADGPKSRMNYSVTIESEGYLDEKAELSWKKSGEEWFLLGTRPVPTTWGPVIRLNDKEKLLADSKQFAAELDQLAPGVRDAILKEKMATLSEKEKESLNLPDESVTSEEIYTARNDARVKTAISHYEVAERAPPAVRAKAHRVALQAFDAAQIAEYIDRYRQNVNFEYWRGRCNVEQLHNTVLARKHVYTAKQLAEKGELDQARAEFEKAWVLWDGLLQENPSLLDQLTADDLFDDVKVYVNVLQQMDAKIPADFKLKKLMERYGTIPDNLKEAAPAPTTQPPTSDTTSTPSAENKAEGKKSEEKDAKDKTTDEKKADEEKKTEEKKSDEKKAEEKKGEEKKTEEPKAEEKKAEDKKADEKKAEEPKTEDKKTEEKKPEDKKPDEKSDTPKEDPAKTAEKPEDAEKDSSS